ncbi:hypothetical protein [Nitrospira sp. M1]
MPSLFNREVSSYKVDVFKSSTLNYIRAIRLNLKPTASAAAHTVSIRFYSAPGNDWMSIGANFSTIQMNLDRYDDMYHILQTEKPVYFTAYELGNPSIRFAGLTTDSEAIGEGFRDEEAA